MEAVEIRPVQLVGFGDDCKEDVRLARPGLSYMAAEERSRATGSADL